METLGDSQSLALHWCVPCLRGCEVTTVTQREAPLTLTAEGGLFHQTGAVLLQDNEFNANLTPVCHHNGRSVLVIEGKALLGEAVVQWSACRHDNPGSRVRSSDIHWPLFYIWYYCRVAKDCPKLSSKWRILPPRV